MIELHIVTFNIRCFGFDGDYFGKNRSESRISSLKNFIGANFPETDVFVFQEIMNPLILDQILPQGFKTYTYQHDFNRHMFIVLACKEEFEFRHFQTIDGTTVDETRSRPAVYAQLISVNQPILDLIGVHLKSKQDHTKERINQCEVVSKFIEKLPSKLPKVMTGDFNTHTKEKTFKTKDDLVYLEEVFQNQMILANHNRPTYLSANETMRLDHFFTKDAEVLDINVYELADYAPSGSYKKYFKEISDHLPVSLKIKI